MRGGGEAGAGCQAAPASSTVARRAYARWRCRPWGLGGVQLPHPSFLVLLLLLLLVVQGPAGLGNCKGVPAGACTPRRAGCPAQRQPSRWFQRDRPHAAVAARGRCLAAQPTSNRRSHVLEEAAVWDVVLRAGGRGVGGWVGAEVALGAGGWPRHARQACGPTPGRHMHPLSPAHAATSTRPPCLPLGQYPSRGPTQPMPATSNYPPNLQHTHRAGPRGECVHSWSGRSDVCVPAGAVQALLEVQSPPPLWSMLSGRVGGSEPPRSRLPFPLPRTHC